MRERVIAFIRTNPGCSAADVAKHVGEDDKLLGRYNRVAWVILQLRKEGVLDDDRPRCSSCNRIHQAGKRPLTLGKS